MKYEISKEKSTYTIVVSADAEEWEKEMEEAYNRTKGKYEVQGFRKGKAPRKQIENNYGSMVFFDDAMDHFCNKAYNEILDKGKEIQPIDYPRLALESADEKGIKVRFEVDVKPEVKLGKYTGLEVEKTEVEVKEDEVNAHVEHELEHVREHYARMVEVTDRALQEGDIATIDFSGSVNGEKFEGGTAEGYELEIGSHTFIEGFEEQLVGMNIGDEKDINVTFPENYGSEKLAGKPAVFAIKLHKISIKELPELNDEWASNVSEFETLDAYKADMKTKYVEQLNKQASDRDDNKLIEAVANESEVEVPHSMVDREIDYLMQRYTQSLAYQGLKLEDYVKYMGMTMEEFTEQRHQEAHVNVKVRLVIEAIIAKEGISASEEEVHAKIHEFAESYNRPCEEIEKTFAENGQLDYIRNEIMMDKLIKYLRENNKFVAKKTK